MTLDSLMGGVIRHAKTVLIRQKGDENNVSCEMCIAYFSQTRVNNNNKTENTETCNRNMEITAHNKYK